MFLVNTNIFLEILLQQSKSQVCKDFLDNNIGNLHISDYSLHSIGVLLFKQNKESLFLKFLRDTLPKTHLVSLPKNQYEDVVKTRNRLGPGF